MYDLKAKTLFSGDAIYNGQLPDTHPHSYKESYIKTLERIENLGAEVFHAGHEPSFGLAEMRKIITQYFSGKNIMLDPETWYNEITRSKIKHYSDQVWGLEPKV